MQFIDIREVGKPLKGRAKSLYLESFPPEERRDWSLMPFDSDYFSFLIVVETDKEAEDTAAKLTDPDKYEFLGFVSIWNFGNYRYVEHFATAKDARGKGLGSSILNMLDGNIVLEVELPGSNDMADRRIGFYERNGFRPVDAEYVQPPYSPELPSLPLLLLCRGELPDIQEVISTLHRKVYGKE